MTGRFKGATIGGAVAVCVAASFAAFPARADDAACVAASEQELPLRKLGKLHDALKQLALCADTSCPAEVTAECSRRIDEIHAAMPTLVLAAKDGAGNDLFAVKVSMDGVPLATTLDGRSLSVDPGEHTFRFETPGQAPVEKQLVLREGDKERRESVVIGPPPPTPLPAPVTPESSSWNGRKTLAVITGAAGLAGVGLGVVFGVLASSDQSQEKSNCSSSSCANRAQAVADYSTAGQNATGSTIGFIAGGVLLAAGAVLWFTAPPPTPAGGTPITARRMGLAPTITGNSEGLVLGGTF